MLFLLLKRVTGDGLWYTSKAAAEKCSGTTFDPSVSAVNKKNYNLYAGHISSSDLTDVEIAVGNKTDYVNVYVGDTLTAANLAPAAAKKLCFLSVVQSFRKPWNR